MTKLGYLGGERTVHFTYIYAFLRKVYQIIMLVYTLRRIKNSEVFDVICEVFVFTVLEGRFHRYRKVSIKTKSDTDFGLHL